MPIADIDCGECINVCPRAAIVPLTEQMTDLSKFDRTVAIPSPALYAQFDVDVPPGVVSAALKQCGFSDVECLSPACDAVTTATEMFLAEYRDQYPLISSFCPTVVPLVQVKYPDLADQLLPVLAPREVSARDAKLRGSEKTGIPIGRIGAVYITPCPGKIGVPDVPRGTGRRPAMMVQATVRSYLIFTGTGPILVLSTYPSLADPRLVAKLQYKGISKFIAYEVALDAVRARYEHAYANVATDLDEVADIRVLDFNGHQIMANFSLDELGEPLKFGG